MYSPKATGEGLVPGESVIRATPEGPPTSRVHHETCREVNGGPPKKIDVPELQNVIGLV